MIKIRSGIGYDLHRLVPGDGLRIGGVTLPGAVSAAAHSDGDVLIHSLADALLGAMAEKDIGEHFPDDDPATLGMDSAGILQRTLEIMRRRRFAIVNVDCVVMLEAPRLSPFKEAIIVRMASLLGIPPGDFNLKGKSKEKTDAVGRGEAVECFSIAMIRHVGDEANESGS